MKATVRSLSELGAGVVLAPERWLAQSGQATDGVPLHELVVERRERAPDPGAQALVLDTTHVRDGLLDLPAAARASSPAKSAKKLALAGDLVVSRLRPYLRQIGLIHPRALERAGADSLALSTEFYVLAPREGGSDLAFLLPFLLGRSAQAILAAAQEGGHHPRVPRSSLLALRVPNAVVARRRELSLRVLEQLDALYFAIAHYQDLLDTQGG
jgi:hypothetical protein